MTERHANRQRFIALLCTLTLAILTWLATGSLRSGDESFLAPLYGMDNPNRWPNEYMVLFHDNHTLEKHYDHIGLNLSSSPHFKDYSFGYEATLDDQTRDILVRRDPGVILLEANFPLIIDPLEEAEEVWESPKLSSTSVGHGFTETECVVLYLAKCPLLPWDQRPYDLDLDYWLKDRPLIRLSDDTP